MGSFMEDNMLYLPEDMAEFANIDSAAQGLRIPVSVLRKILKNGTGPKATWYKGKPYIEWKDLEDFHLHHTICVDGTVIDKVKSKLMGYAEKDGRTYPVYACYCFDNDGVSEYRDLYLIAPDGKRHQHGAYREFGSGDGERGVYFIQEVHDPELAGFSDEKYLGWNALHPKYHYVQETVRDWLLRQLFG